MNGPRQPMPPAMILCGGQGTRLREVTELLPKPMVPIGEQPIVWHIMRCFAAFGVRRFILCLGYKREEFIDYFLNFHARSTDITVKLGKDHGIVYHGEAYEADWEVTLADTGIETMTGGRVRRASRYLAPEDREFFLTYGDGVADIDIGALLDFHRASGSLLTVSAVHPEGRFGEMKLDGDRVAGFAEKPLRTGSYVNGGFMVVDRQFLPRYLDDAEDCYFEAAPMREAMRDGEMAAAVTRGSGSAWIRRGNTGCSPTSGTPAPRRGPNTGRSERACSTIFTAENGCWSPATPALKAPG